MLRDIFAGVLGVAIAVLIVFLSDELSHMMYPLPEGLDPTDYEALRPYIASMPLGAFLMVMGGWVVATLVGAVVAGRIGTAKAWVYPTLVGGLMFAATTATLIAIPHPLWFSAVSLLAILASAWLAWKVSPLQFGK
ncbi:MAG: hypothetical protein O2805_00195 [Proteobacteria bacterium]|nr:hypothetical protein [Pseudomonadota bacterium]